MIQKSEIATYVILALVALNLILTIYYNNRRQEDYQVYYDWELGRRNWRGMFSGRR